MSDQSLRNAPVEDRFLARIQLRDDSCWHWLGALNPQGYGTVMNKGTATPAHRFSYVLFIGPIPEGLQLDHLCRNRACVNPWHLDPVTARENILRGECHAAINARKTHCTRGHALEGANLYLRPKGGRTCRICRKASQRAWERRQRLGKAATA